MRYGIGIAQFAPNVYGHDGQIPGYSTFMVHDPVAQNTIIIGCNLAAAPAKRRQRGDGARPCR